MKKYKKAGLCLFACIITIICLVSQVSAQEYTVFGGVLEAGLFGRYYNVDEVTDESLRNIIHQCISDWNWHLNPDNNGIGVDCYFTQLSGATDYTTAQLNFVQVNSAFPGDEENEVEAITIHLGSNGEQIPAITLINENLNWHSTYIELYTPSLPKFSNGDFHTVKVRSIVNHEIGHAFGLYENSSDYGTIMFFDSAYRTATVPTAADLAGIYSLYA